MLRELEYTEIQGRIRREVVFTITYAEGSMKTVDIGQTSLDACVFDAQSDRVVITRGGNPVAIVVGVEGLDEEQTELGASDKFWKLISERRKEKTLDRSALEKELEG
jgi:hypothetical protein